MFTEKNEAIVGGLLPYTNTTVVIRGCSRKDVKACGSPASFIAESGVEGESSELWPQLQQRAIFHHIAIRSAPKDLISSPAPSKPTELRVTIVNETNALVWWDKPATPNGPIDGYETSLAGSDLEEEARKWVSFGKNSFSAKCFNLKRGTEYTYHAIAYNIDEQFHRLKSKAAVINFLTREHDSL